MKKLALLAALTLFLSACAGGSKVTRIQPLSESADAPYKNVLVVSLFDSFDLRRILEQEVVKELQTQGVNAVASTSMMNTRTPVNRATFLEMVDKLGSDSVLVTQIVNIDTTSKMKDMNPQATYNFRSTYYYNVWSVELTEYKEPPMVNLKHDVLLATQLFSVKTQEPVWTIETQSQIKQNVDQRTGGAAILGEAKAIVESMASDRLIAK